MGVIYDYINELEHQTKEFFETGTKEQIRKL